MPDIIALQQSIKRRNRLAISLIAILVSLSFLSLLMIFEHLEQDAELINLAGSQRMLSQKIALIANQHYHNVVENKHDETTIERLKEATALFLANHQFLAGLAAGDSDTLPKEVHAIYRDAPINLNEKVKYYSQGAIALSETQDEVIAGELINGQFHHDKVETLLNSLDMAVSQIENHINERITYIQVIKASLWLAIMALLFAISFFIFRPLQRLINQYYSDISLAKQQSSELNLAVNKHAIVYRINMDKQGTITEVNQRFLDFYRYDEDEILGKSVFNICGPNYTREYYEGVFKQCLLNEYWHGESINKIKGGRELWLTTTIVPLMNDEDRIESFIVIQNDISGIKQTEFALNQLHQITSDVDKILEDKIQDILLLGKQIFSLPLALVSEIKEQEYKVLYCHTPNEEINAGATFELGNTYCTHTLNANKPIAFHQAGHSDIKDHPCYKNFALESYIGVPLIVEGKRFGTLNFSGPEPSTKPFTDRELDLMQLFAHWISSEITRDKHQNKFMAQQSLLEQMSQQARIGAWEVDLLNNNIYWSSMTKEIHEVASDYQPDLSTAINFYKEGESRDTIQQLVNESIENGTPYERELQLVTAKGNEIWVSARGRSEFVNGQCIRLFGSFQDITDKVNAQYKISQHSQRMALAADSAGIGIWELNLKTNSLKWDDWMFKLYGIESDDFSGAYEAWENGLHPEDKERAAQELHYAVEHNGHFNTKFRIIWPNGEIRHIKASAIVSYDGDGKPLSMVGVNYDVTVPVENEMALTKAKEQAEIAVTAKNEFFASMSHEIRTPMNGVIGMLDLVKESTLNQEQAHRIGIAQQSAKSLLTLINDILDFSKIDANKLELENVSFNLRSMVGALAESFAQQAQQKNVELVIDLVDVEESLVKGDSNRIRQILTNLVANAIKFTKQGEVIIRISQQSCATSQWRLIIEVSDTGIGISQAKQSSLFEAFSQVDASTTREYGGTGLGLAIVKKLCLCMQGNVSLESAEGQGSIFTCDIIVDKAPDSLTSIPDEALRGKRVLIVESNNSCGEVINRQLNHWQLDSQLVNSGEAALVSLNEQDSGDIFDLVLIDQQLKDIDYTKLIGKIRANPSSAHVKIILMTLMASQNELGNSNKVGFDNCFPKPVTTLDLHRALNTVLDDHQAQKKNEELSSTVEKPKALNQSWDQTVKLLLVEDNRVNQMVAMGVLKKIGITHCDIAVNGKDALEILKASDESQPYTFIFMDCQMPEMDGYQATKLIREGVAGARYMDIPIVAMTANAMLGDEQKCLDVGMNDYLVKPINKAQILETLHIFLNKT
ncbi:response regulator [Litorilituus lipolyticus]|uniref:Sensory/regulatory protein RpfC n=1 Tax=Litorilituus lipolyticus TaxID=2491017 RepID=A0A502L577_9GAMM|nr:response regulator [Litorilituus lipolyticus]TPH18129.1 response regulator [Litorilituus lipolyticus]